MDFHSFIALGTGIQGVGNFLVYRTLAAGVRGLRIVHTQATTQILTHKIKELNLNSSTMIVQLLRVKLMLKINHSLDAPWLIDVEEFYEYKYRTKNLIWEKGDRAGI